MTKVLNIKKMARPYKVRYNTIKYYKDKIGLMVKHAKGVWKQGGGAKYIVRNQGKEMPGTEIYKTIKRGGHKKK